MVECVTVRNVTRNVEIASRVRVATSLFDRAVGLIGTTHLSPEEGLWLKPCTSIHSYFMRYTIDIVFLDVGGIVLYQQTLPPWRFSRWIRNSQGALELPVGIVQRSGTRPGDQIELQAVS